MVSNDTTEKFGAGTDLGHKEEGNVASGENLSRHGDDEADDSNGERHHYVGPPLLSLIRVAGYNKRHNGGEEEGRGAEEERDGVGVAEGAGESGEELCRSERLALTLHHI